MEVERSCFSCQGVVLVDDAPVPGPSPFDDLIVPRLEGPWICEACRQQPERLQQARKVMREKLGLDK